jgi:hypothetical protein
VVVADSTEARTQALEALLLLREPVQVAIQKVSSFPWDSEVQLVVLTRADARRVVTAFVEGSLSAEECDEWANAVEGRDDVGLEDGSEELLREFLFEFGTPELTRPLTRSTAEEWILKLS